MYDGILSEEHAWVQTLFANGFRWAVSKATQLLDYTGNHSIIVDSNYLILVSELGMTVSVSVLAVMQGILGKLGLA